MTTYTTRTKTMNADGEREEITFSVREAGGYVFFQTPRMREPQQLCDDMATMGNAMTSNGARLKRDIQAAMRRARAAERRWQARHGRQ